MHLHVYSPNINFEYLRVKKEETELKQLFDISIICHLKHDLLENKQRIRSVVMHQNNSNGILYLAIKTPRKKILI